MMPRYAVLGAALLLVAVACDNAEPTLVPTVALESLKADASQAS